MITIVSACNLAASSSVGGTAPLWRLYDFQPGLALGSPGRLILSNEELLRCAAVSTVIVCWPGGLVDDVVELESGRPELD